MGGFMRILMLLLLSSWCPTLLAATHVTTQIYDIDMGQVNDEPLIFLTNGQVVTIPAFASSDLKYLKEAQANKKWLNIHIGNDREIIGVGPGLSPVREYKRTREINLENEFQPSILENMDMAGSFFNQARSNARNESECFHRAHAWAYEWRIKENLYSSKAWIFFTRRYIRKYKFEWWFHVAPMVHVIDGGTVKERIMDMKYARGPADLKRWTNIFIKDRSDCPVVEKYSDQANHPESGSCFVMKSSMYYYQPVDLERLELMNDVRTRWDEVEVRKAFKDAFNEEL